MKQPDFKIYPSLLDKFQRLLDTTAEDFVYLGEDGSWHRNYNESTETFVYSQDEVDEMLKKEVIDAINRVPYDSDAADKGTAFNRAIDYLLGDKTIENVCRYEPNEIIQASYIEVYVGTKKFLFDENFVISAADYFRGSLPQVYVDAMLDTGYGLVELYGFVDELRADVVYDIKTTSRYDFGKYSKGWQRHTYPYCLVESGKHMGIKCFEYTAYALRGGTEKCPLITGIQYPEVYVYNHEESRSALREICERFIEFIINNRSEITDNKIFNQQ